VRLSSPFGAAVRKLSPLGPQPCLKAREVRHNCGQVFNRFRKFHLHHRIEPVQRLLYIVGCGNRINVKISEPIFERIDVSARYDDLPAFTF
jgi:hypothetical protein